MILREFAAVRLYPEQESDKIGSFRKGRKVPVIPCFGPDEPRLANTNAPLYLDRGRQVVVEDVRSDAPAEQIDYGISVLVVK